MVTTDSNDYYDLLGVSRGADDKEIKSAYKKAARKYHPDNSETGSEEMFKKVGEAYDVLKDPQKKAVYDQYGAEGLKGGAGGFGGFSDFGGGAAGFEDLGDIFSSFFGEGFGGRQRQAGPRATRGDDHTVEVNLEFLDPLSETKKKIKFNPLTTCGTCDGLGAEKSEDIVTCDTCNGYGKVSTVQNTLLGQFRQTTTCPSCEGSGKKIKKACKSCKGKGQVRKDKEVEVTIPAGIYDGATMRLAGVGDAGRNGGPSGDIYLYINVDSDPDFKREAEDVMSEIDISFSDAALGVEPEIKTLGDSEKFKIKAGVQSGEVFTLKNKGFPSLRNKNKRGNLYLKVNVLTPTSLNSKEKKLFEELRDLRS